MDKVCSLFWFLVNDNAHCQQKSLSHIAVCVTFLRISFSLCIKTLKSIFTLWSSNCISISLPQENIHSAHKDRSSKKLLFVPLFISVKILKQLECPIIIECLSKLWIWWHIIQLSKLYFYRMFNEVSHEWHKWWWPKIKQRTLKQHCICSWIQFCFQYMYIPREKQTGRIFKFYNKF